MKNLGNRLEESNTDEVFLQLSEYEETVARRERDLELHQIYAQVLESSHRAVAVIKLNKEIVWVNKRVEEILGYTSQECVGNYISDLAFGQETNMLVLKDALETIQKGKTAEFEHILYKKNREPIWIRAFLKPIYNNLNEIDKYCIYGQDITKEKESAKAIKESETRYKDILDSISEIIYKTDAEGIFTFINKAWTNVTGYDIEETIGRNYLDFMTEGEREMSITNKKNVIGNQNNSSQREIIIVTKSGEVKCLELKTKPEFTERNEFIGFSGILTDITVGKRMQYYQELLSNYVSDFVAVHDSQTRYLFVAPSIKDIAGYEPEELLGKPSFDFYHPDDMDKVKNFREGNISGSSDPSNTITIRYRKKDGSYTWIDITARYFFDTYANAYRTITAAKVADLRVKEEEAIHKALEEQRHLNKVKSDFINFVSHEFKTPLSVIKATTELLQIKMERKVQNLEEHIKEELVSIDNEIQSLATLIDDVLRVEKIEAGEVNMNPKVLNFRKLVENSVQKFSTRQDDNRHVTFNVFGTEKPVFIDAKYVEIICNNLISNAFKYSKGRPDPIVNLIYSESDVVLHVIDFGIGIPEKNKKQLFSTFFRASNSKDVAGTGLGLSIVKKYVELMNGKIEFISQETEGTVMTVTLPLAKSN